MSAQFGLVRYRGYMHRVEKSAFETDERLMDRTWYRATTGATNEQSHIWTNQKYFNMKYIDGSENLGTVRVGTDS